MNWITRGRPKTDRIACPWLITKFIDHDATIVFVAPDQVLDVAAQLGGHSFDAPGATYTHRADHCTFEVLIDEYVLGDDPALALLAIIVHAADIEGELDSHPVGAGLLAIGVGGGGARGGGPPPRHRRRRPRRRGRRPRPGPARRLRL
jgi:hypothetical protein